MTNKILQYSLHNADNYKKQLDYTISDILKKYTLIMLEYLNFINENMVNTKNSSLNKFIIMRGLGTISHVFNIILYHSQNLDMAYYHSQKSFYFYVEFIGQISEEHNTFLHLNSRDASMFVYKKTIFDLHPELSKLVKSNNDTISDPLHMYQLIMQTILEYIIEHKQQDIQDLKKIDKIFDKIYNNNKLEYNTLFTIKIFIESCNQYCDNIDKYYEIIELFIQKILKIKVDKNIKIQKKIMNIDEFSQYMLEDSEELINYIF